jgi:hypothetical protein
MLKKITPKQLKIVSQKNLLSVRKGLMKYMQTPLNNAVLRVAPTLLANL